MFGPQLLLAAPRAWCLDARPAGRNWRCWRRRGSSRNSYGTPRTATFWTKYLSDPIRSCQILSDPIRSFQILSDPIRSYQYLNLIQSLLDLLAIVHCKSIIYSMSIPYEMTSGRFSRDNLIKSLIVTFVWKRQLVWSQRFLFRIKICNPTNQAEDPFVLNCWGDWEGIT